MIRSGLYGEKYCALDLGNPLAALFGVAWYGLAEEARYVRRRAPGKPHNNAQLVKLVEVHTSHY